MEREYNIIYQSLLKLIIQYYYSQYKKVQMFDRVKEYHAYKSTKVYQIDLHTIMVYLMANTLKPIELSTSVCSYPVNTHVYA